MMMKQKYEFSVRMQQRHLKAIVGALRFRQRFLAGDVYGTIGRAAMDAWGTLPEVAHGAYPARKGEKGAVQAEVLEACWAVEFELRARIGHLEAVVAHLDIEIGGMKRVDSQCERMKAVAWQIVGGNYGPWFTYRTRFLYDIYSAIQHEEGHWRYSTVHPLVPSVPLMEISRCV